ncbi:LppM family (lipo)protein [Demequina lignilytica]|uniref:LppM domain-containing protein n=1 Tax=Demequina lignilytica TaxID=3051663 RepID=A0AB35MHS5_9MICO|nr:hypothetical protein [Demequina sp. SYSU T0a273]MDN4483339.1 hypothetical protein [Demequina sp. SYSU T0a273]
MTAVLRIGALTLLALTLSACMRFSADLWISEDGTVDGEYVVALQEGAGAALGGSDREASLQILEESGLLDPLTDIREHGFAADGMAGTEVTFRNQPVEALAPTADRFGVTREGDEYVVSGRASAISEEDADSLEGASLSVSITFPGPVSESNGTVDGTTVTWDLVGGPEELTARASALRTTSPVPAVLTTLLVLGAAGAAAVAARRAEVVRRQGLRRATRGAAPAPATRPVGASPARPAGPRRP